GRLRPLRSDSATAGGARRAAGAVIAPCPGCRPASVRQPGENSGPAHAGEGVGRAPRADASGT
ncbi:hypothetical protein DEF23_20340, partial [Marinitenerispora sediminis]